MERLKFYSVSNKYISYLKKYDSHVPNIQYEGREKFVTGVILNIDGMNYYAPVSSFNQQQLTNYLIKFGDYPIGSIRFSFMFPIPDSEIKLKDFSNEDINYKSLVNRELQIINKNKDQILYKARQVYKIRTSNRNHIFNTNCCDFKLLEIKCKEYEKNKDKKLKKSYEYEMNY